MKITEKSPAGSRQETFLSDLMGHNQRFWRVLPPAGLFSSSSITTIRTAGEKRTPLRRHPPKPLTVVSLLLFLVPGILNAEDNPLVDIQQVNPHIRIEIRYATTNNFMKEVLYPEVRCLLRREVAEKLSRVQAGLEKRGLGLKIFDGYRPHSVQEKMWAQFPLEGYVANPAKGSNHNRGAAVDLTLVDANGNELPMPSAYDEFSERAHRDYVGGTPQETANRAILREAMESEGFKGISTEWWHFDDPNAKSYPLLDLPFSSVGAAPPAVTRRSKSET